MKAHLGRQITQPFPTHGRAHHMHYLFRGYNYMVGILENSSTDALVRETLGSKYMSVRRCHHGFLRL
jgi:hypothetical protein